MKNSILFLSLLFLIAASGYSQCEGRDCTKANMDFQPNSFYDNSHPDWQTSNGTPSVSTNSVWLWSANGHFEGINYSGYNFVKGKQYCVSFDATTVVRGGGLANPDAFFRVTATQGNVVGAPVLPLPSPSQVIANENFNATGPPTSANYMYMFTATENFNNLWFHPHSATMPVVEFSFRNLIICEKPSPCDRITFRVQLGEQSGGKTSVSVISVGVPPGTSTQMQIIKNGSTVHNGLPISYLAEPGNYTICMTYKLKDGTLCKKCFDFCIGKWYSKSNPGQSDPDVEVEVVSTKAKMKSIIEFPEALKEKNIEATLKENRVRVFPNPTSNNFTIEADKNVNVSNIEVYNLVSGKKIKQLSLKNRKTNVNLAGQNPGVYNVKIMLLDGSVIYKKVILKK